MTSAAATPSQATAWLILLLGMVEAFAVWLAWLWHASKASPAARSRIRGSLARRYAPYAFQLILANAPIWAPFFAAFGFAAAIPAGWGSLFVVAIADTFAMAMIGSYVRPLRFMPAWLRAEVNSQTIAFRPPQLLDWGYFWLLVPLALGSNLVPFLLSQA